MDSLDFLISPCMVSLSAQKGKLLSLLCLFLFLLLLQQLLLIIIILSSVNFLFQPHSSHAG